VPVKKHSVEQIIAKLREIDKLTAQGMSILRTRPFMISRAALPETRFTSRL
jgi:hypothetical protein